MANLIQNARLRLKYDTQANWKSKNPQLYAGEVGFIKETGMYKVGDGSTLWNDLPSPNLVIKKAGDPTSSDSDYDVGSLWFNSKEGTLFCLDRNSNWSKMALDEDLQEVIEKLNDYMLTEEYVGATAVKAVEQANTLKANGSYVSVDDGSTDGLWSAEHTDDQIEIAKEAAVTKAVKQITDTVGKANGIASLDKDGKVPSSQLPSYIDDVVEVATYSKLTSDAKYKESDKIYIVTEASTETGGQANTQWRYAGTASGFVPITSGNISVDDKSNIAYSAKKGDVNREVIRALTLSMNGLDYDEYNREDATKKGTVLDRLDVLEDFHATKLKTCARVRDTLKNQNDDPNLMSNEDYNDLSVTTNKLANESVTQIKIAPSSINMEKLADDVKQAIANATGSDTDTDSTLAAGSVDTQQLAEEAVTTSKIEDGAVTDDKILSMSISKLKADSTVTLVLNCGNATVSS